MLFQRINRTDAEKVFIILKNNESTNAWIKGAPVCFDTAANADGIKAVRLNSAAAAGSSLLAGCADAATVAGDYGLVQVYGIRTDVVVLQTDTSIAAGDILMAMTASNAFSRNGAGVQTAYSPWAICMVSTAAGGSATYAGKVFLRCM